MNLLRSLKKSLPHVIVICLIFLFILISPIVNDRYLVNQGKPIALDIELPPEMSTAQFALDGLKVYNLRGVFQLSGWAFPVVNKNIPAGRYDRQIVLQSLLNNYIFSADITQRVDIQIAFNHLDMNVTGSGFSALIFKESIPSGTFRLGMLFKNTIDGSAHYVFLNKCITHTPNQLLLVGMGSEACREITHNQGIPLSLPLTLPVEISEAKFNLDDLTALSEQGVSILSGWAFQWADSSTTSDEYEHLVVLHSEARDYVYTALNISRPDVQAAFKDLGIDVSKSGFAAVISEKALDIGSYGLNLIFLRKSDEKAYIFNTNRCITRNPNGLSVEEIGSNVCIFSAP